MYKIKSKSKSLLIHFYLIFLLNRKGTRVLKRTLTLFPHGLVPSSMTYQEDFGSFYKMHVQQEDQLQAHFNNNTNSAPGKLSDVMGHLLPAVLSPSSALPPSLFRFGQTTVSPVLRTIQIPSLVRFLFSRAEYHRLLVVQRRHGIHKRAVSRTEQTV